MRLTQTTSCIIYDDVCRFETSKTESGSIILLCRDLSLAINNHHRQLIEDVCGPTVLYSGL